MSTEQNLQNISQNLIQSEAENGVVDLLSGIAILLLGLFVGFDLTVAIFLFVFVVIATKSINNKFVYPRTGYAGGVPLDHIKVTYSFVIYVLGAVILLSSLGMMKYVHKPLPLILDSYFIALIGLFFLSIFFFVARSFGIKRLHFYGLLTFIMMVTGNILSQNNSPLVHDPARYLGINIMIFGFISMVMGGVLMAKFAKKHPIIKDGGNDTTEG